MSEPKRASLITIDGGKKSKSKVPKTIRLTVDLSESNESVYPHINFRELVKAEEARLQGDCKGSTNGSKETESDPFFDNDDDVERIARQFEQKYGGSNMYNSKKQNRSKQDDFADIGAGYDENDSFIDNTDGYDEMIPPEIDTLYNGFYINSGCLEFQNVIPESTGNSDWASESDAPNQRKSAKRPLSSSESEESSSSTSDDDSENSVQLEGSSKHDNAGSENNTDGNKSSNETSKKNKSSKIPNVAKKRRKQSSDTPADIIQDVSAIPLPPQPAPAASAATASKTVREMLNDVRNAKEANVENNDGSTDSHTSDPAVAKPVPSSDNAVSSDSSCDPTAGRYEMPLPAPVVSVLNNIQSIVTSNGGVLPSVKMLDPYLIEIESLLINSGAGGAVRRSAYNRCALICSSDATPIAQRPRRAVIQQRGKKLYLQMMETTKDVGAGDPQKRVDSLITRLKTIIDSMTPSLISNYKHECQKIAETNKQIKALNATIDSEELQKAERRLPKRRFPWNEEVRALLVELARIQGEAGSASGSCSKEEAAAGYLRDKVLPMFPTGFVRLPTLLQQARLDKNQKLSPEMLVGRRGPKPAEYRQNRAAYTQNKILITKSQSEPKLPSHLQDRSHSATENSAAALKQKANSELLASMNLPVNTNVTIEKTLKASVSNARSERIAEPSEQRYNPPNSIGSITITPVPSGGPRFDAKACKPANNSVTIVTSPKSERISPNSERQIRIKPALELYNKDLLAQIISGKNNEANKYPVKKDDAENINGVRDYYSKSETAADLFRDVSDLAKSAVVRSSSETHQNLDKQNAREIPDITKPMPSKSYPELYGNKETSIVEKPVQPSMERSDVAASQTVKSYKTSVIPDIDIKITEKIKSVMKPVQNFPAIARSNSPAIKACDRDPAKPAEESIHPRIGGAASKGASLADGPSSKSGESTARSSENGGDVRSAIGRAAPPSLANASSGLKSHRIVKRPKEASFDPLGEVPITGSVIVSPSGLNGGDPAKASSVAEESDSDVELIEEVPQDPLNVPNPTWQPQIRRTNDEDVAKSGADFGRSAPQKDISKPPVPAPLPGVNSFVSNSDADKSKHSCIVTDFGREKIGEKTSYSVKDDLNIDPSEADINTVMEDLKELTNFHDPKNSNKRYDTGINNSSLGLFSQEHSAYLSHNNTALRKTDSTSIPDSITSLSNNTQG